MLFFIVFSWAAAASSSPVASTDVFLRESDCRTTSTRFDRPDFRSALIDRDDGHFALY
jgi:hypothetical protein